MIITKDIISSYITSKHGWAVAEQFEAIYDHKAFEEQNLNALRYIKDSVAGVLKSNVLSQESRDELIELMEELVAYLEWNA